MSVRLSPRNIRNHTYDVSQQKYLSIICLSRTELHTNVNTGTPQEKGGLNPMQRSIGN